LSVISVRFYAFDARNTYASRGLHINEINYKIQKKQLSTAIKISIQINLTLILYSRLFEYLFKKYMQLLKCTTNSK